MTFEEFTLRVQGNALTCGGTAATTVLVDGSKRGEKLIAAAALVVDDKGVGWAIGNASEFETEIIKYLGWSVRLALFFVGGPWAMAARLLVPIIIEVLSRNFAAGGYAVGSGDFKRMRKDAEQVLKG